MFLGRQYNKHQRASLYLRYMRYNLLPTLYKSNNWHHKQSIVHPIKIFLKCMWYIGWTHLHYNLHKQHYKRYNQEDSGSMCPGRQNNKHQRASLYLRYMRYNLLPSLRKSNNLYHMSNIGFLKDIFLKRMKYIDQMLLHYN